VYVLYSTVVLAVAEGCAAGENEAHTWRRPQAADGQPLDSVSTVLHCTVCLKRERYTAGKMRGTHLEVCEAADGVG